LSQAVKFDVGSVLSCIVSSPMIIEEQEEDIYLTQSQKHDNDGNSKH